MSKIAVFASSPLGSAHSQLALEAVRAVAEQAGHAVAVEADDTALKFSVEQLKAAELVILAVDAPVDAARFAGKPLYETRTAAATRHPEATLKAALAKLPAAPMAATSAPVAVAAVVSAPVARKLVAITACPTGIAHTFMAADALKRAAAALGHEIRVETQGSVGAKSQLTSAEIAAADAVILAVDTNVDDSRFSVKPLLRASTKDALHHGKKLIADALAKADAGEKFSAANGAGATALADEVERLKSERSQQRTGAYKHLMTGVSHMLPVVIAGGLAIALAFALGGIYAGNEKGTLAAALSQIGGGAAFQLMVAVLSGFIAFSIADRPGLAPGLVGGLLAQQLGAGFLGGIASGFLAGYLTKFLAQKIRLPENLEGLKPVLILPFLSTIIVGLLMIFVIAPPVQAILAALTDWLNAMRGANAIVLGVLLGGMMAFDMGGPINKASYTFGVGLLASQVYTPMAAIMAAGMTPPLGLAIAVALARGRFDPDERKAGAAAGVLGAAFITEGAIPFAAKDPLRVIPALVLGSAVAGALSMWAGVQLLVPHGGIFAVLIPGAVKGLGAYALAIAAGSAVTAGALLVLKKPVAAATASAA